MRAPPAAPLEGSDSWVCVVVRRLGTWFPPETQCHPRVPSGTTRAPTYVTDAISRLVTSDNTEKIRSHDYYGQVPKRWSSVWGRAPGPEPVQVVPSQDPRLEGPSSASWWRKGSHTGRGVRGGGGRSARPSGSKALPVTCHLRQHQGALYDDEHMTIFPGLTTAVLMRNTRGRHCNGTSCCTKEEAEAQRG